MDEIFGVEVAYLSGDHTIGQLVTLTGTTDRVRGTVVFQACDDARCLPPQEVEFSVEISPDWYDPSATTLTSDNDDLASEGWWSIFIKGLGGGFLALLTPCVFPLIPMTVNFFMKQSGSKAKGIRNAFLYGASIIFIYTTIGFGLTKVLGADVMNQMASNIAMNIIFFLVFIIFGVSFLGAFEIALPSWIANRSDRQADKGGLIGIFFMAFTLAIVSFSCTGPIIGSLLVLAAQGGNNAGPIAGMLGFSTALALPFTLFAIFPSWLANLPKSGGWLNSVKVVLGLVEFALALKFLSNVDLAYHWGILSREVFVSLWIVIFAIIGFYLIGKLKFSHDSDLPYVSVPRAIFAILAFSFAIYLMPGLWGAPLKLMSGLAPPRSYVEDLQWMRRGMHAAGTVSGPTSTNANEAAAHGDGQCPNGLPCTKDYEEALALAKRLNKPIFLDFTGYTCVNCRKMEDNVWVDPRIDKILRNDYVVASLYVDDRRLLPKEVQKTVDLFGKEFNIRTVGNKWTYMQATKYKTNSQPYYVLLAPNEELLAKPVGYIPDVAAYEAFLLGGLEAFKKNGH
jgi:thiol:disulfide interchange protein DsbD